MERHRHRHRRRNCVLLIVQVTRGNHVRVVSETILQPRGNVMSTVTVNVGHVVNCTIVYLDQNGNPMLTTPTPDSVPTWSDTPSPAGCATVTVAPGGLTATDTAVAEGADVISLSLTVGGAT